MSVACDNSTLNYMDSSNQCGKRKLQISWKCYTISAQDFFAIHASEFFICFLKNISFKYNIKNVSFGLAFTLNNDNSDSILH